MKLLLLSSNHRRRYAEDILTTLALPEGAMIQFRYGADYVAPIVQRSISNRERVNIQAVIGFVADVATDHAFLIPVRYATVGSVEVLADVFIFKLCIGSYVDLDQYPMTAPDLVAASREQVRQIMANGNGKFFPVISNSPDLHIQRADDAPTHWRGTARRLALHSTFQSSCFLRVDPITTQRGRLLKFDVDGRLETLDGQSLRIVTSFYSEQYNPTARQVLKCDTDGTFLRVSSEDTYDVALRYDSVEFWLHPVALNFDTLSRVKMSLVNSEENAAMLPANVRIPVIVRRSRSRLMRRVAVTALGAVLVALPSILESTAPIQLRIAAALLGACFLATAAAFLGAAK